MTGKEAFVFDSNNIGFDFLDFWLKIDAKIET